jgi:hypothetical protein
MTTTVSKSIIDAAAAADIPPPDPETVALRMQGAQVVLAPDSAARAGAMGIYPELLQNEFLRDAGYVQMGLDPDDPSNELTDPDVPVTAPPPEGGNGGTASAPVNRDVPNVSQAGSELFCTMGNWDGEPTSYAYQWKLDDVDIPGDGATLPVVAADVGHSAVCVVTATNAHGSTTAPVSNSVIVA